MTRAEEIEDLRRTIAFYQGEILASVHPIETEYESLVNIPRKVRTRIQSDRLIILARAISQAAEASRKDFDTSLDKFSWTTKCKAKFSLCLDCDLKNKCMRYSDHRKDAK